MKRIESKFEMKPKILLPEHTKNDWKRNDMFIINSKYRYDSEPMLKFCYQPEKNIIVFVHRGTNHAGALRSVSKNFNEFVRGIYFRHKNVIYLRMHKNKEWLEKTKKMLEENNLPKGTQVVWGSEWAKKLEEDLRGL